MLLLAAVLFAIAIGLAWVGALGGLGGLVALAVTGAAFSAFLLGRRPLSIPGRARADRIARLVFTVGGGIALLRHPIVGPEGPAPLHDALVVHLSTVEIAPFLAWGAAAMLIKLIGVGFSALGWQLLLRGQGVRLPFVQTVLTGFLIGRFIGTFLPSTLGLDGYTLYEVGRVTRAWPRVVTAKLAEKLIGGSALLGGILLTLPVLYRVLGRAFGAQAGPALTLMIGLGAGAVVGAVLALFVWPGVWAIGAGLLGRYLPARAREPLARAAAAAEAYRGRPALLFGVLACKLISHVNTAIVYWCTALAIGVTGAAFWPIIAGSLLQIVGTLLSPTLGGEGAREALQALLLTDYYGHNPAKAVLAAALGFVAAEAATLWGGVFLWTRTPGWRPTFATVDGQPVAPEIND